MRATARLPHTHLLIAGEGRQLARCRALAGEYGIAGRVTFAGGAAHEDLPRYYRAADQFVLASREHVDARTGQRDVETMGRVLCEAHASGLPVIASRSGGIPSIVTHEHNGLLFEENIMDGLVQCVERLRADRGLARRLAEQGLRDARDKWDWDVVCGALARAFQCASAPGPLIP